MRRRSWTRRPVMALALVTVTGCGSAGGDTTADCTSRIRYDDRTYSSYSFTERPGAETGVAVREPCNDRGASGYSEPGNADEVGVWSFEGYPVDEVLGVHGPEEDSYAVYVADDVPAAEAERIRNELSR